MNTYQFDDSAARRMDLNVGTPDQLFYPANYKDRVDSDYIRRILSTQDIAVLMNVDPVTVHQWREKGWLKGRHGAWTQWKNLKVYYWRHSLKDLEDCLLVMQTRKHSGNPVEHKNWTPQEIDLLQHGIRPEYRSPQACRNKKHRLRKEGNL